MSNLRELLIGATILNVISSGEDDQLLYYHLQKNGKEYYVVTGIWWSGVQEIPKEQFLKYLAKTNT
jgi:hypothetical protein